MLIEIVPPVKKIAIRGFNWFVPLRAILVSSDERATPTFAVTLLAILSFLANLKFLKISTGASDFEFAAPVLCRGGSV
jgi:hypothetical protein